MSIIKITIREWKRLLSIPVFYVVAMVIPVLLFLFYGFIYQNKFAEDLPVAIWDEDHSQISRTLIDMMESTPSIKFVESVNSHEELKQLILENRVQGGIYIPKNLESDIKNGKQTQITIFSNASSLVASKMIYKDAAGVVVKGGLAAVLAKQTKQGMPQTQAQALIQPIKLNTFTLHNPRYDYQEYLTPGLISVGIQMIVIMIGVLMLNWEIKTKTLSELLKLGKNSASNIIVGKTLAFLMLYWVIFIFINYLVFPLYGLSKPGTTFNFFILYNMLVLACLGFGLLVSSIMEDPMVSTDVALFFTSPAFVFSGFTFPRWAMPWYDEFYAELMPYTHFLDGLIKGYYMELPFKYFQKEFLILTLITIIFYSLAVLIYQRRINHKYLKNV